VNEKEGAFDSLALKFSDQCFEPFYIASSEGSRKRTCPVKLRKDVNLIKIKQRNTVEGVSKICGLWLIAADGTELAKIDLCEGQGTWRVQTLHKDEYIIGFHYYVLGDDEILSQ